ncbi:unnamed protein product, partial [Mycena citricolor]
GISYISAILCLGYLSYSSNSAARGNKVSASPLCDVYF